MIALCWLLFAEEEQGIKDKLRARCLLLLVVVVVVMEEEFVVPAPPDTMSELLLVEKVLALGLDCPPFAVLAFIPISSHESTECCVFGATVSALLPVRQCFPPVALADPQLSATSGSIQQKCAAKLPTNSLVDSISTVAHWLKLLRLVFACSYTD